MAADQPIQGAERAIETVRKVLHDEPDLLWAYVFGSTARGERYRDVDVAIAPAASMPAGAVVIGELIARLEAALGVPVDLVDVFRADLPLLGPMLQERIVVLDRDPDRRRCFEAESTSRWLDFRPWYEEGLRIRSLAQQRRLKEAT